MKNSAITKQLDDHRSTELQAWYEQNPWAASRGIEPAMWQALTTTLYPGAKPESVLMAVDYCNARKLDIMLKPVHLVAMNVKDQQTGQYGWRDVPMPGIGLYRIQADRSGTYAGSDEPEFGDLITQDFTDKNNKKVTHTFPEWCKITVYKLIGDRVVGFTAKEYWLENYATDSGRSTAPNSMWAKRSRGQLAKCAEAQALRKAWPEIGSEPTAEEMEGKTIERELNPQPSNQTKQSSSNLLDIHKQAQGGANKSNPGDDKGDPDKSQQSESQEQSGTMEFTLFDQIEVELDECQSEDRLKMIADSIADHKQAGDISDQQARDRKSVV